MTTASNIASATLPSGRKRVSALPNGFALRPLEERDIGPVVSLVCRAMNPDEGGYAAQTLHLHFASRKSGVDDGRLLYVLGKGPTVAGIVGLRGNAWGPPENAWLSWFALDPSLQGQGLGAAMLEAVTRKARQRHFMKLYVETYSTPEFARARALYRARGFRQVGRIQSVMPGGGNVVVFYKPLAPEA